LGASIFFAYQIFKFVNTLKDGGGNLPSDTGRRDTPAPAQPARHGTPDATELLEKADAAYGEGNSGDARLYLERAEKLDPDNPEVLNKLGFILTKDHEYEAALAKYSRSLVLDPDDDLTHNAAAAVLRKLGRLDEAQEHYKAAVDIDDSYEETYFNYGELLLEKDDKDGARMMFEKALELKPDYKEANKALEALA
jgi:tetratricopeptide (TPR) repeat protein